MNSVNITHIAASSYDQADCAIGVVHLGYGAFHRAHQAVYIDTYMAQSGDLNWGIAAVNLRAAQAATFAEHKAGDKGYLLKSVAPNGEISLSRVRSHLAFSDWSTQPAASEEYLSLPTVKLVTITVTESGYYTDPKGALDLADPVISAEIAGGQGISVYAYLAAALAQRKEAIDAPVTICCCDNIRSNGKMLQRNFMTYLAARGLDDLRNWVSDNAAFPCSMVDRITPRATNELAQDLSHLTGEPVTHPVMAEAFVQWVLEDRFASDMPDLAAVGVTVTGNVDPFEETKIRVLNGGHTCLAYLAALRGISTFDQAMLAPDLFDHFWAFETTEVLPALTLDLPFSKEAYLDSIAARFKNPAIADTVARICADGVAKFPIFIRPTLEGCLRQGILPRHGIQSIASWYVFAKHVGAGKIAFDYAEPSWPMLESILHPAAFIHSQQLWGDLPLHYPEFADALRAAIKEMEQSWPI
jgi:D-arabinitol 4-dehydrogenase